MVVQQISNAERADNNRNSTAEDFSNSTNSINFINFTTLIVLSQSTHWKVNKISLFDPHLNKSHEDSEIVTVSKDVYYWSVMLFIKCI